MNKVIQINGELKVCGDPLCPYNKQSFLEGDSDIVVQSGIKWEEVNRILAERKIPLFFPVR